MDGSASDSALPSTPAGEHTLAESEIGRLQLDQPSYEQEQPRYEQQTRLEHARYDPPSTEHTLRDPHTVQTARDPYSGRDPHTVESREPRDPHTVHEPRVVQDSHTVANSHAVHETSHDRQEQSTAHYTQYQQANNAYLPPYQPSGYDQPRHDQSRHDQSRHDQPRHDQPRHDQLRHNPPVAEAVPPKTASSFQPSPHMNGQFSEQRPQTSYSDTGFSRQYGAHPPEHHFPYHTPSSADPDSFAHQSSAGHHPMRSMSRPASGLAGSVAQDRYGQSDVAMRTVPYQEPHHRPTPSSETSKNASVVIKVGMVGDAQIGKTSLMVKYVEGSWDEDYIQTLGT